MTAPARRTVRSGGGCGGARSICPRRRDCGMARPAQVAPRRQPGSAFGHSLRARVLVARSCAHLRSVRPSDWPRPRYPAGSAVQRSIFVVRDLSRHAVAPILVRSRCSISRQTSLRTLVCRQPSDVRQPVINPQLSMMDFVYKIRVTLSSKKCMCCGPVAVGGGRDQRTYKCFVRAGANDP